MLSFELTLGLSWCPYVVPDECERAARWAEVAAACHRHDRSGRVELHKLVEVVGLRYRHLGNALSSAIAGEHDVFVSTPSIDGLVCEKNARLWDLKHTVALKDPRLGVHTERLFAVWSREDDRDKASEAARDLVDPSHSLWLESQLQCRDDAEKVTKQSSLSIQTRTPKDRFRARLRAQTMIRRSYDARTMVALSSAATW